MVEAILEVVFFEMIGTVLVVGTVCSKGPKENLNLLPDYDED